MTDEQKLLQFRAIYESEIGNFPGNAGEQAGIWFRFIAPIPPERYEELIRSVSDAWGARPGKPRLREFRQAWKSTQYAERDDSQPQALCAACDGHGVLVLPVYDLRHNGRHLRYEFGRDDVPLTEVAFPCRCTKGRNLQSQLGITDALCAEAWEMHRDIMKASGHAQIEEGMTKAEFLATQPEKACISPNGMKWRMVFDSRQAQREALSEALAQRKEEKAAPRPKPVPVPMPDPMPEPEPDTSFDFGKNEPVAAALPGGYDEDDLPF